MVYDLKNIFVNIFCHWLFNRFRKLGVDQKHQKTFENETFMNRNLLGFK